MKERIDQLTKILQVTFFPFLFLPWTAHIFVFLGMGTDPSTIDIRATAERLPGRGKTLQLLLRSFLILGVLSLPSWLAS